MLLSLSALQHWTSAVKVQREMWGRWKERGRAQRNEKKKKRKREFRLLQLLLPKVAEIGTRESLAEETQSF